MTRTLFIRQQSGSTLLVAMIILILMTLIGLTAMRLANTNLRVVSNEQFQRETQAATAFALDAIANSPTFASANAQTITVDVGAANYNVAVTKPSCKRYRTLPKSELVTVSGSGVPQVDTANIACFTGSSSSPLTIADLASTGGGGASLCAGTLWEVQATATPVSGEVNTGVTNVTTEGVEQRMTVPDAQTSCK